MHLEYSRLREDPKYRASEISYEQDITIFNATKLKINIEGCVNTLSEECTDFYDTYGKFLLTLNFKYRFQFDQGRSMKNSYMYCGQNANQNQSCISKNVIL